MKVMFATYPMAFHVPGGGEIQLLSYQRHLPRHGVEVSLLDPWKPDFLGCDLVHFFSCVGGSWHFCAFVKQLGLPLVVSSSLWLSPDRLSDYPAEEIKTQLTLADAVVTNSNAECSRLSELLGLPREKFFVVKNAIEECFLKAADPAPFRKLLDTEAPFVLNVGNIERRKNQALLAQVMKTFPTHRLVLVGAVREASYWAEVQAVAGPNLTYVSALPHASELLRSAYAGCALFALPSLLETPGLAALEAAAQGAPLIVTSEGCCQEYFGECAVYVDPRSAEALHAALVSFLMEPAPPKRPLQTPVPTWPQVAGDLRAIYQKVLASAPDR
jgi:glycosyltransferase involved in cell wall biosynthesis